MTTNQHSLVKVETDVPAEQLSLIGCGVTTGVGAALNTAEVQPGSTVAVLGCGGVGTAVIQGARIAGASRIIAVDGQALKREQARSSARPTSSTRRRAIPCSRSRTSRRAAAPTTRSRSSACLRR